MARSKLAELRKVLPKKNHGNKNNGAEPNPKMPGKEDSKSSPVSTLDEPVPTTSPTQEKEDSDPDMEHDIASASTVDERLYQDNEDDFENDTDCDIQSMTTAEEPAPSTIIARDNRFTTAWFDYQISIVLENDAYIRKFQSVGKGKGVGKKTLQKKKHGSAEQNPKTPENRDSKSSSVSIYDDPIPSTSGTQVKRDSKSSAVSIYDDPIPSTSGTQGNLKKAWHNFQVSIASEGKANIRKFLNSDSYKNVRVVTSKQSGKKSDKAGIKQPLTGKGCINLEKNFVTGKGKGVGKQSGMMFAGKASRLIKKGCRGRCSCLQKGLPCTQLCISRGNCDNSSVIDSGELLDDVEEDIPD